MANDLLQQFIDYNSQRKMRAKGIDVPLEYQLTEEEKEGAPLRPFDQMVSKVNEENATPEQIARYLEYKKMSEPKPSLGEQLKPPRPESPSPIKELINRAPAEAPAPEPLEAPAPQEESLNVLDFGQNTLANQEGLQAAQQRQNDLQFLANMNRAFGQIAGGLSQTGKPDSSIADAVERQGKQQVENYQQQVDFQKQDPNSSYSKGLKDYFKTKLKMEIRGDASAAELEKIMPFAVREYESKLERERLKSQKTEDMAFKKDEAAKDRDLKRELLKEKAEAGATAASEKRTAKEEGEQNSFIERTSKQLEKHTGNLTTLRNAKSAIDEAVKNPSSIKDVSALYSFIKALDPASVVREGEIALANRASGLFGSLTLKLSQLTTDPKLITAKNLKDIQSTVTQLHDLANSEYDLRRQTAYKRAKSRKITEDRFGEFDPYHTEAAERETQGLVKVRQKSTGKEKTISAESAKKYLGNKDFEEVK